LTEIVVAAALLTAGILYVAYTRPKTYEDIHRVVIPLTLCTATFFVGAYVGADKVHSELMPMIGEDDWDFAAQFSGGAIPVLEALIVCALALIFFFALRLLQQIVEANEE
jgi:hypothetical protein